MADPTRKDTVTPVSTGLSGPAVHVLDRFTNSHRKASSSRPTAYEAHTVASQKQLENTRVTRKGHSFTQVPVPTFTMVAGGEQHAPRSTITPNKTCTANLYRRIKRRVGRSLKRTHCKRVVVSTRKQAARKLSGTKSSLPGFKRVQRPLFKPNSTGSNRQHHSGVIHKQEGGMKSGPLCALLWRILTWCTRNQVTLKARHIPGRLNVVADKLSRLGQTIQTEWSLLPEVFQTIYNRPICHEVQQQAAPVCFTSPGSPGCSSGRTQSAMEGSGHICLPTSSHIGQSGGEVAGFPLQKNHSDCPGVAEHALVLGPVDHVQPNPTVVAQSVQPFDSAIQPDPSQKSGKSESKVLLRYNSLPCGT